MMDIKCKKCGEPWDIDTLHDVAEDDGRTFNDVRLDFQNRGCEALGGQCNSETHAHPAIGVLYDILGDDIDGAAAMFEDFNL